MIRTAHVLSPCIGVFAIGLLVGVATRTSAQSIPVGLAPPLVESLTMEQAVQEAVDHNLELIARRFDVTLANAGVIAASLRPNPVFSFGADHLDWIGTHFNDVNHGGPTEINWRVDVPVERGRKRDFRIDEATTERSLADAKVADVVRVLTQNVQLACVDLSAAAANLSVSRDTLRTFEELANLNDERVRVGAAPPYEATRTRVAMLQFRASVSRAERDVRAASIRLRQLVGRPDSSDTIAIIGAPVAPAAVHAPDLSALQTLALQHRADLQASRLTEARSRADLLLQLAVGKVDLTWGAEYRRQSATAHSNSVGLFFSVPLPVHNRNQGEIARSEAAQQQAGRETSAVEAAIRADVRSAFDEFTSASALVISIEQDLLALAMSARDTAAYAYRAGGSTLVELLDSQRAWNDTMQSYQQAQADYHRAIVRLNSAVGTEVIR